MRDALGGCNIVETVDKWALPDDEGWATDSRMFRSSRTDISSLLVQPVK